MTVLISLCSLWGFRDDNVEGKEEQEKGPEDDDCDVVSSEVEKRARGSQGGSRGRGLEVVGLRSQGRAGVEVVRPSRGQDRLRLRSRTEVMSLRLWLERGLESRVAVAGPRSQGRAGVEVERNGIRIQDHGAVEASSDSDSSGGFV
ncbi:hypothetical protein CDL15_Pgr000884 [Punica granatum]|uniref:Uncharacterized protein n=1 Tax=Punica granatum TaxID=22663 RepID=A0A218XGV1_PUNGR|nr:hypothetical protein CDL15_Pgr000884 [Punica granatum]